MAVPPEVLVAEILKEIEFLTNLVEQFDEAKRLAEDDTASPAAERSLEIISEASRRFDGELKATQPEIPWKDIAGIGNILRHEYFRTDPEIIWATIQEDLPPLYEAVLAIKANL